LDLNNLKIDIMNISTKLLHWLPRILCILAILLISVFALDAFNPELTLWNQIIGFIRHLIPSFILILLLVLAWKKELIGGIVFTIIGLGLSPLIFIHNYRMNHSVWMSLGIITIITIPFTIVGILFILSHYRKKRLLQQQKTNGS
jgi:peptidoglycan/LPS O-acetylase OafA/YrhL